MPEHDHPPRATTSEPRETYIYGANPLVAVAQGSRTADRETAFLLPHLRRGMRLLDAGCGGGSITVGLAAAVSPGQVVGLDREAGRLAEAQARARTVGATLHLIAGDGYQMPFADQSFDAVVAHHLLQHLRTPLDALREFFRVLRPGGLVGIRDPDEGATLYAPAGPSLDRARDLELRLRRHYGGDPHYARNLRGLLRAANFVDAEVDVTTQAWGTTDRAREAAAGWRARLAGPAGGAALVALGWVTPAELATLDAAIRAWGEDPDAFSSITFCTAVALRP